MILLLFLFTMGLLFAVIVRDVPAFLTDPLWPSAYALPPLAAFVVVRIRQGVAKFLGNLRPWLANSKDQIDEFEGAVPKLLLRFFWPFALFLLALGLLYALTNPSLTKPFAYLALLYAPFIAYFLGGASAILVFGLGSFARQMAQSLDLQRGFILSEGRVVLVAYNRLLRQAWVLTLVSILLLLLSNTPISGGGLAVVNLAVLASAGVTAMAAVVIPQVFMNRLLAREKAEELRSLRQELDLVASPPEHRDLFDILQRMQRHSHLLHLIEEAKSFNPTLVDVRFALQIATSFTAILLANVVLRIAFARLLE